MSSIYNGKIQIQIFGESHQPYIGLVINNLKAGICLDMDFIRQEIRRRQSSFSFSTPRHEKDDFTIISGYFQNHTTGAPLVFLIANSDVVSSSYQEFIPRPGHADYASFIKNKGFADYRGGGHFSGRLTLPLVIAGAIAKQILKKENITIASHIYQVGDIFDDALNNQEQASFLQQEQMPFINQEKKEEVIKKIKEIQLKNDSLGGSIECVTWNVQAGLGEPFFASLESKIATLAFSIPGVKGIEFGHGFAFAHSCGSEVIDFFYYDENQQVQTNHNFNGGINGGISNGMPIVFRCAIKPTPSIFQEVQTIDLKEKKNTTLKTTGRHDVAIFSRCSVIIEAVAAIALLDAYMERYGSDFHG